MPNIKWRKIFFIFFSVAMFFLGIPIILEVFNVPNQLGMKLVILLLVGVAVLFKSYFVKIPIYLVIVSGSLFVLREGSIWTIINQFRTELQQVVDKNIIDYPEVLPHLLILLSLVALIEIQFVSKRVLLIGGILIGYLLLLNIFNEVQVTIPVLLIAGLTLLLNTLISEKANTLSASLVSGILLSVLLAIVWFVPTEKIENKLLQTTTGIRSSLSNQGFYYAINEKKYGMRSITGFGEDDSELGGAIEEDHRVQFRAIQERPHYWRIDSKNRYTGKGWEATGDATLDKLYTKDEISVENGEVVESQVEEIRLLFATSASYVPTTYGQSDIRSLLNKKKNFTKILVTNRIDLNESQLKSQLDISLNPLIKDREALKQVPLNEKPSDIDYLQLPPNYSKQVTDLATEITQDKVSLLDKVESIEQYLKTSPEFRYSKSETTYPNDNQDYVEHFLFESQVGYCDNFSTSMVVMLRSIGIPARWAKGFNTGVITSKDGDRDIYSIRNQDAHSWPEVYFEGFGWIPFEPTPTFIYPTTEREDSNVEASKEQDPIRPKETTVETTGKTETTTSKEDKNLGKEEKVRSKIDINRLITYLSLIFILMIVFILIFTWKYRIYLLALFIFKYKPQEWTIIYIKVLHTIETRVYREPNMPLSDYSRQVERQYPSYKPYFSELTECYEKDLYGAPFEFNQEYQEKIKKLIKIILKNK